MSDAFICSAVRTPIGKFLGALSTLPATKLGALVVAEAVRRAGVDPAAVGEVIMGNVLQAGLGQNPARAAARGAGIPDAAAALTINKVCGSGLKAVMLAAQAIRAGDGDLFVAGGMESMSRAPYLMPDARTGSRLGHAKLLDSMVHDGLWDHYYDVHMGETAERTAEKYGVTREQMDLYAVASHKKAISAIKEGCFRDEILPVELPKGRLETDEGPREDASAEKLATLKPAFRKDGVVTPGNSSTINDGAAALVVASEAAVRRHGLRPMARITGYATGGTDPQWVLMAPVEAAKKMKVRIADVDLVEINEAFAAQCCALIAELKLDPSRLNVHGGAVALGHPIGASGARVLTTLLHAMKRRGAKTGMASLCLGGGNAVALSVEAA